MGPLRGSALLSLLLVLALTGLASAAAEGGNLTGVNLNVSIPTLRWGAAVGTMNTSVSPNATLAISALNLSQPKVYADYPNGSFYNLTMLVTRLDFKPPLANIQSPAASDFDYGGMFANFTSFYGLPYASYTDDPQATFCNPCQFTTCTLAGQNFSCPYVTLKNNSVMAVLKYVNGSRVEPLFVTMVSPQAGFNGSVFDFEYLLPAREYYYFYAYGDLTPPVVTITSPVGGATYASGNAPLIFTATDNIGVDRCWYVLDSVRTDLPSCNATYMLTFGTGGHAFTLYANDTSGNIGSASVFFYGPPIPSPPAPSGPSQGGGPPGTPIPQPGAGQQPPPQPPQPPPPMTFTIQPENIFVLVIYPEKGTANFTLSASAYVTDVRCYVLGDFGQYSYVELESGIIHAGGSVGGRVIVDMTPTEVLNYRGATNGTVQCVGYYSGYPVQALAGMRAAFRRPAFSGMNSTAGARIGEIIAVGIQFMNNGTADAVNLGATLPFAYRNWMALRVVPGRVGSGDVGTLTFSVGIPGDAEPGEYYIPVTITENGFPLAISYLILNASSAPIGRCLLPDLLWTAWILIGGMILSAVVFRMAALGQVKVTLEEYVRKQHAEELGKEKKEKEKKPIRHYGLALALAMIIGAAALIIWALLVWWLLRCY